MPGLPYQIQVNASVNGYLNAWIDFNGDGDFLDAGERINTVLDQALTAGNTTLTFTAPAGTFPTTLYSRFRFTRNAGEVTLPTDLALNGEVEDYALMSLGNVVWFDIDDDGIKDAGENGIQNIVVSLLDNAGNPINDGAGNPVTATTDINGNYRFTGLTAGDYKVKIGNTNFTAGNALNGYYSTTDQAGFNNPNNDNNETTDENGIDNTAPATNGITTGTVTLALGAEPPAVGSDGDTDANSNMSVDFGFYTPVNIGNLVWHDANNNGIYESGLGETGIDNVTVQLFRQGDTPGVTTPRAVQNTTGGGFYNFTTFTDGTKIDPGTYFVYIPTPPAAYPASSAAAVTDTADNEQDNDDNGTQAAVGSPVSSPMILLTSHAEPTTDGDGNDGDMTIDFGLYHPLSLGNFIWDDKNGDGIQNDGAGTGISGATVSLFVTPDNGTTLNPVTDVNGNTVNPTSTDASGFYTFNNLPPGDYVVRVSPPAGYLLTTGGADPDTNPSDTDSNGYNNTGNIESLVITLKSEDEPAAGVDGDDSNGNLTVDFGFYKVPVLGDLVWNDFNRNGVQDPGEPPISGVTVQLWQPGADGIIGTADDVNTGISATTDTSGIYSITTATLSPGNYYLRFTPDATYQFTTQDASGNTLDSSDSDVDSFGRTGFIALVSGVTDSSWDAGLYRLDFGDLPDTGAGFGAGNYQTNLSDSGARHTLDLNASGVGTYLGGRC